MTTEDDLIKYLDDFFLKSPEEIFKDAKPTSVFRDVRRQMEIEDLKEIYGKDYLVPNLMTEAEYNSVPAGTRRRDELEYQRTWSELADQVFGAENV